MRGEEKKTGKKEAKKLGITSRKEQRKDQQ